MPNKFTTTTARGLGQAREARVVSPGTRNTEHVLATKTLEPAAGGVSGSGLDGGNGNHYSKSGLQDTNSPEIARRGSRNGGENAAASHAHHCDEDHDVYILRDVAAAGELVKARSLGSTNHPANLNRAQNVMNLMMITMMMLMMITRSDLARAATQLMSPLAAEVEGLKFIVDGDSVKSRRLENECAMAIHGNGLYNCRPSLMA